MPKQSDQQVTASLDAVFADFDRACAVLLPVERGKADDDNGAGPVNWGITERFLKSVGDFRHPFVLSWEDAKDLYRIHFWNPWKLGRIEAGQQKIADYVFGLLVNTSPQSVVMRAQRAVNLASRVSPALKIDGKLGNMTLSAINACRPERFADRFYLEIDDYYKNLVIRKPANKPLLGGWLNRNRWFYLHSGALPDSVPKSFDPKELNKFSGVYPTAPDLA